MQWLAAISVKRPVFASVLILTLTVIGAFSFSRLGLDRFPKVDFPTVVVQTRLPGAAPEEIETEITDKIEEAVNTISGIDELRSTSSEGVSTVIVAFLLEKDGDIAAQEVRDRVNRVLPLLPKNIQQPVVDKFDPDAAPVMTLAVSADKPIRDITEYADKTLRRQLESVSGVGQVVVVGGRQRQINITLDPARLQGHNLTVTDVSRALQAQNAEIPGGRVEAGSTQMTLRTRGRVQSVAEFADIVVRERDGHPILLRDVATVEDGMADPTTRANVSGTSTVLLTIRRQSGINTVAMVDAVNERLADIKAIMPPGYKVWVVRDLSEFIRASINTVEEHLVLGSILAALVVLVFLWNWRSTIIAAIAIPTSIIATFGLIWYEDFTLNSMTMLALTLAVGIVIDDAIVVLENIYRYVEEHGMNPYQAAVVATKEIGLAVMATTLSLIAIFVPVGFMGGIVGRFMKSFGLTMSFAIMVSLLVSFTLTPMLSARWIKAKEKNAKGSKDNRFFKPIDDGYRRLLAWSLAHRAFVAAGAVLILLSSVPLFMVVNKNFLPNDDQSEFEIGVRAPEGTSIEATELVANRIAAGVRRLPEVDYTLVTIADDPAQTQNSGTIYVRLKPLDRRKRDQFAVMNDVRANVMPQFASANLRTGVRPVATIGGGGNQNAEIQFTINGPDLGKLEQFAGKVADAARGQHGAVDVDTSLNVGKPELSVKLDRLKAADLGVQVADAAEALRLLVGGDQVTTYNEGGEQYEVHVRAAAAGRATASGIGQMTVPSSTVGSVPLENIADLTAGTAPSNVDRLNRQRQVTVYAGLLPGVSQVPVMDAMTKAGESLNMGPGYSTRFAGRSRELGRAAQNFLIAFVLSLVFMYLILAAQFESWLHPVTILLSLPLTLPFALLSIIITRQSLNIFSALGLLVLFGVVKKNSILQIDHANQLRETGMPRDAAILQASHDRLRPILMTTAAFVAGMIPLVLSSGIGAGTNRAIGFVIIGGQSLVLVLSLLVTPVAYSLLDDLANVRILPRLWALARRAAPATAAMLALAAVLLPRPADAQPFDKLRTAPSAVEGQPTTPTGEVLRLNAEDAVRMAAANNPDLVAGGYDPRISAERLAQASAVFLPTLTSGINRNVQQAPPSSVFFGNSGVRTDLWSGSIGLGQRLPVGGGAYTLGWNSVRSNASNSLSNFNPAVTAQIQAAYSQPLLRDFKIDQARAQVTLARQSERIADIGLQELGTQVTSSAARAYWNLVLARANVAVQQQSLDLSLELERNNRARVDVGQSPPLDLVSARAEVAQRREQLIVARTLVRQAEDQLRVLILDPKRADYWYVRLETVDLIPPVGPSPDVDAAVRNALAQRTDLERTRRQIEISDTNVSLAKNSTMPDLRVQASYLTNGLGGTELVRSGFLGPVTDQAFVAFGDVLGQLFSANYPTWQVGFTFSYPLGRSVDQANYARTKLEREQTVERLRSAEFKVVREVRQAAMQLDQNRQRIETTRLARELSEQRLDAEQKRFEVGMSTNFNVIQAQRDLAVARNSELLSQLDYQQALINFDTVQRVGGSSATTVTTGTGTATVGTTVTPSGATVTTVTGAAGPGGGN